MSKRSERPAKPCKGCGNPTKDYRCTKCRREWRKQHHPEVYEAARGRLQSSRAERNVRPPSSVGKAAYEKQLRSMGRGMRNWLNRTLANARSHCKQRNRTAICTLTIDDLMAIYERQEGRCAFSGVAMTHSPYDPRSASIDRLAPGGDYSPDNVHLVCKWLNLGRGRLPVDEFQVVVNELRTQDR